MPDEEECFLLAILDGADGLDLAEWSWYDPESPDGCYRAWDFQWCLAGDTVMYTDRGRQRIADAVGPVRLLTADEGDRGRWVDAEVTSFGRARLWRIDLVRRGVRRSINATAGHRWLAGAGRADRRVYESVLTRDLAPGDYLRPVASPQALFGLDRQAVQAGVVFGDGTVMGQRSLVRLYGDKRSLAEWFDAPSREYLHHSAAVPCVQVSGLSLGYKTWLPALDEKSSVLWGWLAGYFAMDGSVLLDGTCVVTSVDRGATEHVRDVATALGVVCGAVADRQRSGALPGGRVHTCTEHRVVLRVSDLPVEFFLHPEHRRRRVARGDADRAVDAWRVEAVTRTEEEGEVYCAVVPGTHNFVLDGDILTGNSWYTNEDMFQVDQGGRATGKTVSITMRAFAFPFNFAGQRMLVTAPELNHLRPLTDAIEQRLLSTRLGKEMLPGGQGNGMNRQPHWQVRFKNGTQILSRLPNKDGKGVKSMHVIQIELDEAQDYPLAGWVEIVECLNRFLPNAQWRCHGVPKGTRDRFFEMTEGATEEDKKWTVHRPMAMNRPTWANGERGEKIKEYGGSRQSIDYKRNIYGEHGDAANSVFVLSRLTACVDLDEGSVYNSDVYQYVRLEYERLPHGPNVTEDERQNALMAMLDPPGTHRAGYSQKVDGKEVGAPKGYSAYWGGADIGVTNHPSEFLIFGQREGSDLIELLLRIQLQRIPTDDQMLVVEFLFDFYGDKLKAFALDKMQPVSEPVLTPSGWRPIGGLRVGDQVIGSNGVPTEVLGVYPQVDRRVMKVICTDGSWTRCGPEHLWTVKHSQHVKSRVMTTEELAVRVNRPGAKQWTLPMLSGPSQTESDGVLPLDPYVLGALLGNGNLRSHSIRFSSADAEVVAEVDARLPMGYVLKHSEGSDYDLVATANVAGGRGRNAKGQFYSDSTILSDLRLLGLAGKHAHEKWVPAPYLQAGPEARLLLLRGLMDTDGYVTPARNSAHIGIRLSSEQLIKDIVSLVESFGGSAHYRAHATSCNGKPGRTAYRATIVMPDGINPFRLSRKADAVVPRTRKPCRRYVDRVEWDGEEDSVCIRVAAADELYVTRHYLLTHNTGVGQPIWDMLHRRPDIGKRIYGYNFSEHVVIGFEDRLLEGTETQADLAMKRNVVEATTDWLRNDYVDAKKIRLPYDRELLLDWQGQVYSVIRDNGSPYGKRRIFSGGSFHCVDQETELLTEHGWRRYDELNVGDAALTLDIKSGTSRWGSIEDVSVFAGPAHMVSMETRSHSSLTTGNHRWPVRTYDPHSRTHGALHFRTTDELRYATCIPLAVPCADFPSQAKYSDALVELIAWFWTEGNATRSNTNISQSQVVHPEHCDRIRAALTSVFGPPGYALDGRSQGLILSDHAPGLWHEFADHGKIQFQLRLEAGQVLRDLAPVPSGRGVAAPVPIPQFLRALTAAQLQMFVGVSELGDGNHSPRSTRRAFQHLRDVAQSRMIEMTCALAGIPVSTSTLPLLASRSGETHTTEILTTMYRRPGPSRRLVPYDGVVWCPRIQDGTWLARRNGSVYWTGNSLDAAKMMIGGKHLPPLQALLEQQAPRPPVLDLFIGGM